MRVYIAGPMTGLPDFNYPAFHAAEAYVRANTEWQVENPARHFGGRQDLPYEQYMREAVRSLTYCDAIMLLSGWEASPGARFELTVARKLGLDVFDNKLFYVPEEELRLVS